VPFAPYYLDVCCLDDNNPAERQRGMDNDAALFERGFIDELHLYGDRISEGMKIEILLALHTGIPVIASNDELYAELQQFIRHNKLEELQKTTS
jgi:hypothetical protein